MAFIYLIVYHVLIFDCVATHTCDVIWPGTLSLGYVIIVASHITSFSVNTASVTLVISTANLVWHTVISKVSYACLMWCSLPP